MTKTLQEIQQENRAAILPSITFSRRVADFKIIQVTQQSQLPITLSIVLLALKKRRISIENNGWLYEVFPTNQTSHIVEREPLEQWDLQKETLEEQSEETQRAINELLK